MLFEEALQINKHNLDEEWLRQPMLCKEWLERFVEATEIRDKLKQKIKILEKDELESVRANLDIQIRSNPNKYAGDSKLTENYIGNLVVNHPDYKEALAKLRKTESELIEANSNLNTIEGARDIIFYQRKATLEYLTQLYQGSYFIRDVVPKDTRERTEAKLHEEQNKELAQNPRMKKLVRK